MLKSILATLLATYTQLLDDSEKTFSAPPQKHRQTESQKKKIHMLTNKKNFTLDCISLPVLDADTHTGSQTGYAL